MVSVLYTIVLLFLPIEADDKGGLVCLAPFIWLAEFTIFKKYLYWWIK